MWADLEIVPVRGFLAERRGLGILLSFIFAMDYAAQGIGKDGTITHVADINMFFEDDAHPFPNSQFPSDLYDVISFGWESRSAALFLGSHDIIPSGPSYEPSIGNFSSTDGNAPTSFTFSNTKIGYGLGCYAFAVRAKHLRCYLSHLVTYFKPYRDHYEVDVRQ